MKFFNILKRTFLVGALLILSTTGLAFSQENKQQIEMKISDPVENDYFIARNIDFASLPLWRIQLFEFKNTVQVPTCSLQVKNDAGNILLFSLAENVGLILTIIDVDYEIDPIPSVNTVPSIKLEFENGYYETFTSTYSDGYVSAIVHDKLGAIEAFSQVKSITLRADYDNFKFKSTFDMSDFVITQQLWMGCMDNAKKLVDNMK